MIMSDLDIASAAQLEFICLFTLLYLFWYLHLRNKRSHPPLPPGPRGLPIIGNLLQAPSSKEWETYAELGKKYGDIASMTIFGTKLIILSSATIAEEMLDVKGSIYSDRETSTMMRLCGWSDTIIFLNAGEKAFKKQRMHLHKLVGTPAAVSKFGGLVEDEGRSFLRRLLESPDDLADHIRHYTASLVLRISYGYETKDNNDPFIFNAERGLHELFDASAPATWAVDYLPFLTKVPDWFLGANFKKTVQEFLEHSQELINAPYNSVKKQMASGTYSPSFASTLIESVDDLTPEEETFIKCVSLVVYTAGTDTTYATLRVFFLAMTLYPSVFKRAQAEVDTVVGSNRLPQLSDRINLPYLDAMIQEIYRWNPVVPAGIPHKSSKDDIHAGYFIPKGSIVIANIYSMLKDPRIYTNPESFCPERFLGEHPEKDPRQIVFGHGRRICSGRLLADDTLFVAIAMSLVTLDIQKKIQNGIVIEPICDSLPGIVSHLTPYEIEIKPRSPKVVSLVNELSNS